MNLRDVYKVGQGDNSIQEGFHDDWQLVVELIYEMDAKYAAENTAVF